MAIGDLCGFVGCLTPSARPRLDPGSAAAWEAANGNGGQPILRGTVLTEVPKLVYRNPCESGGPDKVPRPVTRKLVAPQDTFSPIQERKSVREAWFWCFVDRVVALGGGIGRWHWVVRSATAFANKANQPNKRINRRPQPAAHQPPKTTNEETRARTKNQQR